MSHYSSVCGEHSSVYKIILIGDSDVGKTCLQSRFMENKFPEKTQVTVAMDLGCRIVTARGKRVSLQLWDTAGMEKLRQAMPLHYYRNVNAVLFVYDVTNEETFMNINNKWIEECKTYQFKPCVLWFLIGNKCDCKNKIVVTTTDAKEFAEQHTMTFYEVSAKEDSEIVFDSLLVTVAEKLEMIHQRVMIVKDIPHPVLIRRRTQSHKALKEDSLIPQSYCGCQF